MTKTSWVTSGEFESAVGLMRRLGVYRLKIDGLEIELGQAPAQASAVESDEAPVKESKRGQDGLSKEEQIELYGRVMDAE